jgi:hypothetical protein
MDGIWELVDIFLQFTGEKVSKISLVDLAGSERAQKTGVFLEIKLIKTD